MLPELSALLASTAAAEKNKAVDMSKNCKVFIQDMPDQAIVV
jgi:hypothetical protein